MKNVSRKKGKLFTGLDVRLLVLLAVCVLLLVSPLYLRMGKAMFGSSPYFYERIIGEIEKSGFIPAHDEMSFAGREFTYSPAPLVFLYILSRGVELEFLLKFLPLFFGVISLFLSYCLLRKFRVEQVSSLVAAGILLISPSFLYVFSVFSGLTIAIPVSLLAFYLFFSEKRFSRGFSFLLFGMLPFFGFWESLLPLSVLAVYSAGNPDASKRGKMILVSAMVILAIIVLLNVIKAGSIGYSPQGAGSLSTLIFDIGGGLGASIFAVVLVFFGLSRMWEKKYKNIRLYAVLLLLAIAFLFERKNIVYLNFALCFFASGGLLRLKNMEWESKEAKAVTLFLFGCGLLFSGLSFINSIGSGYPDKDMISSLEKLGAVSKPQDIILSHESNSDWINGVAGRKTMINEETDYMKKVNKKFVDAGIIFHSRDIRQVEDLLKEYKIKYVYITPNMKEGLLWNSHDEGFLFVSKYSKLLERKYEEEGFEIWRIKQ
jgi:hypothetical protein